MNQHLVSRALLRRFAITRGGAVGYLDLDTLAAGEDVVEKLAAVQDFLKGGAAELERKWDRQVENRLGKAFAFIDRRVVLDDSAAEISLQRLVALHWARGYALHSIHENLSREKAAESASSVLESFSPNQVMRSLTGLEVPEGPASFVLAHERLQREFHQRLEDHGFLASQLERHYSEALRRLERLKCELWYTDDSEFLLGDCPVVTWDKTNDRVGVLGGAAWDQSDHLVMVLGPHVALVMAQKATATRAPQRLVEMVNVLQVRGAFKRIFFRPDSGLGQLIADSIRANETASMRDSGATGR